MKRFKIYEDSNERCSERYELAKERIFQFPEENVFSGALNDYFNAVSSFVKRLDRALKLVVSEELYSLTLDELKEINSEIYRDILGDSYRTSFLNPDYACKRLGKRLGKPLCAVFAELFSMIYEAYSGNRERITVELELIVELYGIIAFEKTDGSAAVKRAIFYFHHDYCYEFTLLRQRRLRTGKYNDILCILDECSLSDLRYLYYYGAYIGENEEKSAEFINSLTEEEIDRIADVYVGGYERGFAAAGIDFSERVNVEIRYPVGFERIVKASIKKFREKGKEIIMYMDNGRRTGVSGSQPNRQFVYDHRNDFVLYYSKKYLETEKECLARVYEELKDSLSVIAGPACIEAFGEADFAPINKENAVNPDARMNKLIMQHKNDCAMLLRQFADMEKVSFTIIAYPLPEIGKDYEKIFMAANKVNMLDSGKYSRIQQKIIDVLDKGRYVTVEGAGKNKTKLKIMLHSLEDPEKETNFENCTADVNIPVGEVFTSPVLKGTEGVLNVRRAFLEGLEFINLKLEFKDGMVTDYSCENFKTKEENRRYIEENILFRHESLPMGEFAIGTNTAAYKMAGDYGIWRKLPILIAEKTGPHFAVGDTCYSDSEDFMTYNPDGKAIVARDNEVSMLRKTDRSKAYFHCHTDITIPYDELKSIRVHCPDGEVLSVIEDGVFTVDGTEELNKALTDQ